MLGLLRPICEVVATLDLSDADEAKRVLEREFSDLEPFRRSILAASDLTPKIASPTVRFGRLSRATPETFGVSIDAVEMSGRAAEHIHPRGEVSLAVAIDGRPRFMGEPEGWVVAAVGSRHIPEVSGGSMRIVYFLPGGAVTWC